MYEVVDFLETHGKLSGQGAGKRFEKILKERSEFIKDVLVQYSKYVEAFLDTSSHEYFSDRLELIEEEIAEYINNNGKKLISLNHVSNDHINETGRGPLSAKEIIVVLEDILNPNYSPPLNNPIAIQIQLEVLCVYCLFQTSKYLRSKMSSVTNLQIEFAGMQLIEAACYLIASMSKTGEASDFHKKRTNSSKETKKKKADLNSRKTIEEYIKWINKQNRATVKTMTKNCIAGIIQDKLKDRNLKRSTKQITIDLEKHYEKKKISPPWKIN